MWTKVTCCLLFQEASCLVAAGYSGRHCIHKSETEPQPPSVPLLTGHRPTWQTGRSLDITLAPQSSLFFGPHLEKVHCWISSDQILLSALLIWWIVFIKRQTMEIINSVIFIYWQSLSRSTNKFGNLAERIGKLHALLILFFLSPIKCSVRHLAT